jgi:hypothetical protein
LQLCAVALDYAHEADDGEAGTALAQLIGTAHDYAHAVEVLRAFQRSRRQEVAR